MVVCGVKHLGDEVGVVVFAHRLIIFALRKELHVEVLNGLSLPQPEHGNSLAVLARYHHVVCGGLNFGAVYIFCLHAVFGPLLLHLAVELYLERFVASVGEPYFAAGEPHVGELYLPAVDYLLFEEAVFIAERIAHCGVVARCERVQKACGKPAETAVAEACVGLEFIQIFKVEAVRRNDFFVYVGRAEIVNAVFKRSAEKEFHAEVINALCALGLYLLVELLPLFEQNVAYAHYYGFIHLLFCGLRGAHAEIARELALNGLFNFLFGYSCAAH